MVGYRRPVDNPMLGFKYLFRGNTAMSYGNTWHTQGEASEGCRQALLRTFYIPSFMFTIRISIKGMPEVLLRRYVLRDVSFPFHVGVFSVSCRSCLLSWTSSCLRPSSMSTSTRIHFCFPPWGGVLALLMARQRQQALPES